MFPSRDIVDGALNTDALLDFINRANHLRCCRNLGGGFCGNEWDLSSYCLSLHFDVGVAILWGIFSSKGINLGPVSSNTCLCT